MTADTASMNWREKCFPHTWTAFVARSQSLGRWRSSPRLGPATIGRTLGLTGDFSGCYVLADANAPKYVGISRKVLSPLRQHVRGRTHFDASLAYAIAQRDCPTRGHRGSVMEDAGFRSAFAKAQAYLRSLQVACVQIDNPVELHVFEAYAALSLRTHENNGTRSEPTE
jgi:hypothetical protein